MGPQLIRFKNKLVEQGLSEVTIRGYLYDIKHFWAWLKGIYGIEALQPNAVGCEDLKAYRQELTQQHRHKAASVNRRLQALKRFFSWEAQIKEIPSNPSQDIRLMRKQPLAQPLSLNKKEVHRLLCAARQSSLRLRKRNYALIQLLLQTGLRISEVARLQARDVTIKERSGVVRVAEAKGLKEREVPLNQSARQALLDYSPTLNSDLSERPLWITQQGKPPTVRALQLVVNTLARHAQIKHVRVTPHTLRHTFATNYLNANPGSLVELASLLGHESLNTTAIYTKASKELLAQGVERSQINIYGDSP